MRYLLFIIFCISCDNHTMPKSKDLYDIDADGIENEFDQNPEVVDLPDWSRIAGRMSLYSNEKKHLGNVDFETASNHDEYLATNLIKTNMHNDFFTEYTSAYVKDNNEEGSIQIGSEKLDIHLQFEPTKINPSKIYVTYRDREIFLANWNESVNASVSGIIIKDLLSKKAKLSFSFDNFGTKEIEELKLHNKRVIYESFGELIIFYIAKNKPTSEILSMMNLSNTYDLSRVNLYSTQNESDVKIWVKEFNNNIIVIEDSLENIYQKFLTNFEEQHFEVNRINGKLEKTLTITKSPDAAVILKFQGSKTALEFSEHKKDIVIGGGGKEGSHDKCRSWYRQISKESILDISSEEFINMISPSTAASFLYNGVNEIAFRDEKTNVSIEDQNLDSLTYLTVGRYASECKEVSRQLAASEGYLKVSVVAYVEKP